MIQNSKSADYCSSNTWQSDKTNAAVAKVETRDLQDSRRGFTGPRKMRNHLDSRWFPSFHGSTKRNCNLFSFEIYYGKKRQKVFIRNKGYQIRARGLHICLGDLDIKSLRTSYVSYEVLKVWGVHITLPAENNLVNCGLIRRISTSRHAADNNAFSRAHGSETALRPAYNS